MCKGNERMRNVVQFVFLFSFVLVVAACTTSEASVKEIERVPKKIEEFLQSDDTIQFVQSGKNKYYIILSSAKKIEASVEEKDGTLYISFDESGDAIDRETKHVFELNDSSRTDTFDIIMNGESVTIDSFIIL